MYDTRHLYMNPVIRLVISWFEATKNPPVQTTEEEDGLHTCILLCIYIGPTQWKYTKSAYDVISIIKPLSSPISVASDRINDKS